MTAHKNQRRSKQQWQQLIEDQNLSGLSIQSYCKKNGVATSNFYAWRQKLKPVTEDSQQDKTDQSGDWIPLGFSSSDSSAANWDIELSLPSGITLKMRSV